MYLTYNGEFANGLPFREPGTRTGIISLGAVVIAEESFARGERKESGEGRTICTSLKGTRRAHRDLSILRRPQPHVVKSNLHCPPDFELLLYAEEARALFPAVTAAIMKSWAIFEHDCLR